MALSLTHYRFEEHPVLERLLHEIMTDPQGADHTWRVLADWLEEQGDPRSELVRFLHHPNRERSEERDARVRELLDVLPPLFENSLNAHFSWVLPGTFWMGGGGGQCGETQVMIAEGFALGVFPVAQGQWQAVMGSNPSCFSRTGKGKYAVADFSDEELTLLPVENVSWDDVQEFIETLNEKEYGCGWLYRLPTEAEWEYACRGGVSTEEECSYHFYFARPANDRSEHANFDDDARASLEGPMRTGWYPPNRLGLYDMHSNVWEWCQDLYSEEGSGRVRRGGRGFHRSSLCRAANRNGSSPTVRHFSIGFRLARVPGRSQDK